MTKFGECLKQYRFALDMSQEDLARKMGTTRQVISRYERGERSPRISVAERFSEELGIPLYKMGENFDESPELPELPELPSNIVPITKRRLPVLGTIAAGVPIFAEEEHEEFCLVDACEKVDYALRVQGDSMIGAGINDGDYVFIRQQEDVDDGQIAAVLVDDSATLKRVYHGKDHVMLAAENPKYKPQIYGTECEVRILGLAVLHLNKVV